MADNIIRDATPEERKDFVELNDTLSYEEQFRKELHAKEREYTEKHKPYDRKGAYHDFEDKKDELLKRYQRYGASAGSHVKYEDFKLNLDKYGDIKRFKLLSRKEARDKVVVAGKPTDVLVGFNYNYQCIHHSGAVTVYIPLEEDLEYQKSLDKKNPSVQ